MISNGRSRTFGRGVCSARLGLVLLTGALVLSVPGFAVAEDSTALTTSDAPANEQVVITDNSSAQAVGTDGATTQDVVMDTTSESASADETTATTSDTSSSASPTADATTTAPSDENAVSPADGSSSTSSTPDTTAAVPSSDSTTSDTALTTSSDASSTTVADGWYSDQTGLYLIEGGTKVTSRLATVTDAAKGTLYYWIGSDGYAVRGRYVDSATGDVYLADVTGALETTGWHVTDAYGDGLQRYWVDETAHACVPGYSADGWDHYTLSAGYVLRGKCTDASTGCVYLADNDGRLESPGWHVTSAYGSGMQRYWVDEKAHACVPGYSADGWDHYTTAAGYVLRGKGADPTTGDVYLADNDGLLESPGWHVTDAYGSGLQRYWVDATAHACVPGYSADGWAHFTTAAGYVLRGTYTDPKTGYLYLADNDGLLAGPGWVVADYGSGLQRYWVDSAKRACVPGYSADGWAHYTTAAGYVLRGASTDSATGYVYLADNDGLLAGPGWIIGDFGNGLQRYWVDAEKHACVPGYSKDGWAHWTTTYGYVLRGAQHYDEDGVLLADNEGKLAECYSSGGWLVTSAFTGSLERYRIDDCCGGILGAHVGPFSIGDDKYCGNSATGYVYRNCYTSGLYDLWGYFDNDGILRKLDGAPLTETQKKILAAAETTPSPGLGWCAAWVEYVYENAVGGSFGGDARDLYKYYCTLSDISQIRPGMIVAVSTHSHSSAGRRYGHVGIYMGNGVVYDNEGYIRHISLLEWVSYYGDIVTPKWGVLGNISLD